MPLFDTHAHLDDDQLFPILADILAAARNNGLAGITAIGTTLPTSRRCVELANEHDLVSAAVGIHPNRCADATVSQWDQIKSLAIQRQVVAIGETGLDRHWDYCLSLIHI